MWPIAVSALPKQYNVRECREGKAVQGNANHAVILFHSPFAQFVVVHHHNAIQKSKEASSKTGQWTCMKTGHCLVFCQQQARNAYALIWQTVLDNFAICMLALLGHILHSTFLFDLFQTLLKSLTFSHHCTRADNRPKWWSGFLWVLVNMSRVRLFQVKCQLDDSVDFGRDLMLRTIQNNGEQVVVGELRTSASFFNQLS